MIVTWRFLCILSLVIYTRSECSSTSYYRNCWIRRFPGLRVDAVGSERRGARLLQVYHGDSAQNCSRACCLTSNFSCNVAVFHYNTTQESVNCFHLHCPTLQSCIIHQSTDAILYNVTKGMDPDLLIFEKYFPSNAQVLPNLTSLNTSDLSGTDKRQFNRPHMEPSSTVNPTIHATSTKASTSAPTSSFPISTRPQISVSTQDNHDTLTALSVQRSTSLKQLSELISTRITTNPSTDPTILTTTTAYPPSMSTIQLLFRQTSSMPQHRHTSSTTLTSLQLPSQLTSSSTYSSQAPVLGTTAAYTTSQTTEFKTRSYLGSSTTLGSGQTTTVTPVYLSDTSKSSSVEATTVPVPIISTPESSTVEATTMPVPLIVPRQSTIGKIMTKPVPLTSTPEMDRVQTTTMPVLLTTTPLSRTGDITTTPALLTSTPESSTVETSTIPVPLTTTLQGSTVKTAVMPASCTTTLQNTTGETTTLPFPFSSNKPRDTEKNTTMFVPLSSSPQNSTGETPTMPVPLSSMSQNITQDTVTTLVPLPATPQSSRGDSTTEPVHVSSILQSSKGQTTDHHTLAMVQLSSSNALLTSTPLTPAKTMTGHVTTTMEPQVMINSFTTTPLSYNKPINMQSTSSLIEKRITPSSRTDGLPQVYTSINLAATDISLTTTKPTTLNRLQSSPASSETNSGLKTSPTPPILIDDSQPYPNDTKGYTNHNVTTGNSPQPVSDEGLMQVWHLAANSVLIALATCAALACGCCCSVLMAASWRGRRRRKGRYHTTLKGKKGSMRLIKYVFVRESS